MMYNPIKFPEAQFMTLGRNGYSKSCGISAKPVGTTLFLEPINSQGDLGRARLVVPLTHLQELRDKLSAILAEHEANIPETVEG